MDADKRCSNYRRRSNYNTKLEKCQECIYKDQCDNDNINYTQCPYFIDTDFYISSKAYEETIEYYWREMSYNRYSDTILTWQYDENNDETLWD